MRWLAVRRRLGDDKGSATIETVFWIPVYVFFLTLVFDTSMTFLNQAQILRLMQDANRAYATGRLRSLEDTEAFIRSGIVAMGAQPQVSSTLNGPVVRSTVAVRAGDLGGVGLLAMIANLELRMATQHLVEG